MTLYFCKNLLLVETILHSENQLPRSSESDKEAVVEWITKHKWSWVEMVCGNANIWATVKIRQNYQPKTHKGVY